MRTTHRRSFPLLLMLSTHLLRFGCFLMVVWPPSLVYFEGFYSFFVFNFCICLWASPLFPSLVHPCNDVWVLVTQYTLHITFTGDLGFIASVSQTIGPASPKVLPPRTLILSFNLGCPALVSFLL